MSTKTDAVVQPEPGSKSHSLSEKLPSDAPSVAELPELQKGDTLVPASVWAKVDFYVLPVVPDRSSIGNSIAGQSNAPVKVCIASVLVIRRGATANVREQIVGPRLLLFPARPCSGEHCKVGLVNNYPGLLACECPFNSRLPHPASAFSGLLAAAIIKMDGVGDPPGWAWLFILALLYPLSGLAYFLPSIVAALGYAGPEAQLMSVSPFAVSAVPIGFGMFDGAAARGMDGDCGDWMANNSAPLTRRATYLAPLTTMTKLGSILSTWLLGAISSAPKYISATITLLVFQFAILLSAGGNIGWLTENKRKEKAKEGENAPVSAIPSNESIWYKYDVRCLPPLSWLVCVCPVSTLSTDAPCL
ncbi:hypothetical protein C8Q74DRAFT_1220827 [Fomes fomentarius]|nr:hypothetical protein C8Q74DRAFT_1220827 [Fomes fomentarius]